jgi:hypothetical protein
MNDGGGQLAATSPTPRPAYQRVLLIAAEVLMVAVILALLALIWLPTWVGARPGSEPPTR